MDTSTNPFRIVVGLDFSDTSLRALDEALAQAASRPGAEVHVASVLDNDHAQWVPATQRHASLVQLADDLHEELERVARPIVTRFNQGRPVPILAFIHVRVGAIADQLTAMATEIRANLVVVGTHGRRGIRRLMMGSVAEKTVRLAPCPVLVVRPLDFRAMEGLPVVEAACTTCIETREKTGGEQWWCATHTRDPDLVHIYSRSGRLDQPLSPAPFGSS